MVKKTIIILICLICSHGIGRTSDFTGFIIGYNFGMYTQKLKYFERINYEYKLAGGTEDKFMYNPLLRGMHFGFGFFPEKIEIEFVFSTKKTKSNEVINPITGKINQYKIKHNSFEMTFRYQHKKLFYGISIGGTHHIVKKKNYMPGDETQNKWQAYFSHNLNFSISYTFHISYRPVKFLEFRPYIQFMGLENFLSENNIYYYVMSFNNLGININFILR